MQNSDNLRLEAPSLPKGGGALTGLSGQMGAAGPDGAATLSLPLPVSAGRGYAPPLSLNYNSQGGNGPFGMGWGMSLPAVRRRTRKGAPTYTPADEFLGPDGEVLVPALNSQGEPETVIRNTLLETLLPTEYQVMTYRPRVERDFSVLEYWQPKDRTPSADFWLMYSPDGQVHLLGYEPLARISNPDDTSQTAQWLLNSTVSAVGEQIYYRYRAEDAAGCSAAELAAYPNAVAQRYISEIHYGNRVAGRHFPCLTEGDARQAGWLFVLVFDYGERSTALAEVPPFAAVGTWACRQDCLSGYENGFALRTRRLCRQVLMFHRLATLAGEASGEDTPALVSRLLLSYTASPHMSMLVSARQMAFEPDEARTPTLLPPLQFGWQTFSEPTSATWQTLEMGNLVPGQPWQYVDLAGEGLAGILYQDQGAWWYRAPVRDSGSDNVNAVVWDRARPLPGIPSLGNSATLTDLNGDGHLDWVVSAAGVNGYYGQDIDRAGQWLHFTPLAALPVEYAHPRAQMADLTGNGLADLVLIGPRSVRLYAGQGEGWQAGQTVLQSGGMTLPVPGADPQTLVAFSDPLGSGQQHLVQIRADGVTCWPNLGQGRFGQPLTLSGFSQPGDSFHPDRISLADIDGSGAVDIIYAHADRLDIYRNCSGNGFAAPFSVSLPDGVRYDSRCQIQVADVQGLGVASLLLNVPHPVVRHYVLHLAKDKPGLLNTSNNSMGAHQTLHYRSSAQFWLDDKAEALAMGTPIPGCYLPFALHILWRTETQDEITGNRLSSEVRYGHGVWDGQEQEFRGFGYVAVRDTDSAGGSGIPALPSLTRSWYATGVRAVDERLRAMFWAGDNAAFPVFTPRYTLNAGEEETECPKDMAQAQRFWLTRALKGQPLRTEVYGLDGSEKAGLPYSVTEQRPQVRLITATGATPVVWPSVVESRSYHYERIASDPQCAQQITLRSDAYGLPLREVSVNYPRRPKPAASPYPDTLPETLFASSYDDQQQVLRLSLTQTSRHHLTQRAQGQWMLGLADGQRGDVLSFSADRVPQGGLRLETLSHVDGLLSDVHSRTLAGQQQSYWQDEQGLPSMVTPAYPPRLAYTDSALLDAEMVQSLSAGDAGLNVPAVLEKAGYRQGNYLFTRREEQGKTLWMVRTGSSDYGDASQFWRPQAYRESPLTGKNTLRWDDHYCAVLQHQDAAGLTVSAEYDWRFLSPIRVTDVNANVQRVSLDALGRVVSSRFSGTESGVPAGYSEATFTAPDHVEGALALMAPLPVAQCYVYAPDSWSRDTAKLPPHTLTLTTDRYDSSPHQQIRQQVTFSDGFGRVLQTAARFEAGQAWLRGEEGALVAGHEGGPDCAEIAFRWAVSGRTEYDSKGQAIRTYQPYFLNDWRYVSDDSARRDLYADTHYYDPVGREYQVTTAKGGGRRTLITPWFRVAEDENDTLT
ncbi:SpvB/TcaC N-terminal domain-containing protein [Serratia quinivorans]|uniref:SpvB/TcaC N-terminal domain-containing protein n=1 Tax=Serratia quinivorans TaxID=137545 RepID=UPI0034C5E21D